ncbi:hypothetical protein BDQ12DRAFT_726129 [Crucibulum laeve]|uniref:DUF6532 domain-containing protein n=1 Tax=Crucibulum laeve TaxID=68775 RepID=A0A5C3LRF2_9AGAR|nr:hypothetical protein BDQ12DRAFT_726129 [Crucibulum laeve]
MPMSLALCNSPVLTSGGQSTPLPQQTHVMLLPESNKENIDSQLAWQAPSSSPSPLTPTLRNNLKCHYSSKDGGTEYNPDVVASKAIEDDGPRSSKKKGLCASDLNPVRKCIVQHAYPHFCLMIAKDSFPTEKQEYEWAMAAWYLGLGELVESHGYIGSTPPTQSKVMLITMHVSQLRGQVKIATQDTVDEVFHFKTSDINDDKVVNATCALIVKLKAKKAFIYKDFSNLTLPASIFSSELIKKVLCKVWFGKQQDSEGITHPMYFKHGIPLGVLTLICTAIS